MTHHKRPLAMARPTRRAFIGTTAAVAGLASVGTLAGLKPARAQTRGGTIRVAKGHGNTNDSLDPATWTNGFTVALAFGMHGFLTKVATDGSLDPDVAESWEASSDAKSWRFKIRPGMTFHSGKPVTLDDVIASVNYHRGENSTSVAKPLVAAIVDIKKDGEDTVVFDLETGSADFPFVFTDYHMAICPADDSGSIDWRSGDGCGSYRLTNFDPGVVAEFERFQDDWNQERGWFDAVEMLSIVDLNARTTALVSGEVDAIDKLDLKTVALLGRNAGVKIHSIAGPQYYSFAARADTAPLDDVNVRLALKHAINREELVEKILFGHGTVGNDQPIGPSYRFHNPDYEQTPYDPDKAKYYLQQAGLDGLTVKLSAADAAFPGAVDAAVLYQNAAGAAGIKIDVNRVPNDGYWSDVWLKHPFCAVYWGGRPTADQIFTTAYESGAAWNDSKWSNARFDELLVAARAELDEAKRREMYYEMQQIVSQDGGTVLPMFANFVFATNDKIVQGEFASNFDMDGERWMERWSFA
ncbi:ABC transporter substrate-binding protein [Tropicimonas isoalkanivorans]|uniref:Peptide/nickel transport system substrate-binding protein n=1 Tax=Tropicimonas isoalkanivorans TaxID=441112 RepID=A0A1I1MAQ2_9RHOB|nr:ABC transporter substrate-binding protein [Tropicimonas isoalkanivorans]SFC79683.1 peptide/nickel transport system substrate-binding protein [Tropicimonas isoalkanivorans]